MLEQNSKLSVFRGGYICVKFGLINTAWLCFLRTGVFFKNFFTQLSHNLNTLVWGKFNLKLYGLYTLTTGLIIKVINISFIVFCN